MRNLLRFIIRYNFPILFIVLELAALWMLLANNPIPHTRIYSGAQSVAGYFFDRSYGIRQYLDLRSENDQLARENSRLKSLAIQTDRFNEQVDGYSTGSDHISEFEFIPARVINNSVNKQSNYLTLDKGSLSGIRADMAVVAPEGIVGVVRNVSAHYAVVIPVINSRLQVSVVLKNSNYFGSLTWDGQDYRMAVVNEMPAHFELSTGDTLVTSGYSALFPPGEMVGTIEDISEPSGGSFRSLRIRLSTDFKKLSRVYVVHNLGKAERIELESIE